MAAPIKILNYELAPSPATIFGCLLPAPWLGAAAGLLLAFGPTEALPSRFAPLTLALTHWLALGMLAPVMIGALFQLLPVVAGQTVNAARWIAPFVALGSLLTVLGLSRGFLYRDPAGFHWAAIVATVLYGSVALALLHTGCRVQVTDATTGVLRWIGLPLTVLLFCGVTLAGGLGNWWSIDLLSWLDAHVSWALLGWLGMLVAGVAGTTVPMFWQTPRPAAWWQRVVPWLIWGQLGAALVLPASFALVLGALSVAGLSASAARTLLRAKRRFDPAWVLWMVCSLSWLTAALLVLWSVLGVPAALCAALPWWIGVLVLVGGGVLPVNAMLGKIIPFLVFLHLRRRIPAPQRIPTMQMIILPQHLRWQARLVLGALLALLALPCAPNALAILAGLSFAAAQAWLATLLLRALFRYRKELRAVLLGR